MDKNYAIKLIQDVFQSPFNREQFIAFTKNIFNFLDTESFIYRGNFIPDAYKPYIHTLERIGKYEDAEDNKIDVLIVHLKKEHSIEHARTMQRNFIAWYLSGSRGGQLKDAALVAFHTDNPDDWRFSLVKMDYQIVESETGKIKTKTELTPARRFSFLVGENENSHTAQRQLLPILQDDKNNPLLSDFEKAFNIEVVTQEFFEKYKKLFLDVKEALEKIIVKNPTIAQDFTDKAVDPVDFSKKLLGQIVFLYFLQKKGWFGVLRGKDWGEGDKKFLRNLFLQAQQVNKNYFNKFLEPLFYEALRLERPKDYYDQFDCRIPFLNGGLFDPINDYDWQDTDIELPNNIFSNDRKTKEGDTGDGILDIFDRYNFTVKEDEPLEKEVAVDPEMLGKVFENLLEVKDRKSKGTYYTPREIVHYMCQESLINYLISELSPVISSEARNLRKDIEILIQYGESAVEHDSRVEQEGKETQTYSYKLPESIRKNAHLIDEKLKNIRVCDPAIGSGAFPVGMMNEIIRTRNALTNYLQDKADRSIYNFKRDAIQNSLYGVDIDPGAVEIAKLRLWLSLIVDEEERETIQPLPNLDYKIMRGDSLLGIQKEKLGMRNMFFEHQMTELEELKRLHTSEATSSKKKQLKDKIDELISGITNGHKDFDFEVYFSEVFHEKGGFDVVIANPPYVSYGLRGGQKMSESEKKQLKETFPDSAEYKISLYAIFMDKAIRIAKHDNGVQTFIVPDSFLLGRYFSKIRNLILRNNEIGSILLLPYGVFEATVGFSVVYCFQRKTSIDNKHLISARLAKDNEQISRAGYKHFSYSQSYFERTKYNRFRLFFDKETKDLIQKIDTGSRELGETYTGRTGVRSKIGQKNITAKQKERDTYQKGLVSGGQILRFKIEYKGDWINIDPKILNSGGWDYKIIHNPKILIRQTGDSLIASIDKNGYYHLNNVHSFAPNKESDLDLRYVLGILNSILMNYYYQRTSLEVDRPMAQTDIETIESLPIKYIISKAQKPFIEVVDKILAITDSSDYPINPEKQAKVKDYERQIDQLVYKLYGLTQEEIAIVGSS